MAVKRETRQFKVGTIGVARSSRAGAIVGEAVAQSANAMSQIFYERAAENAKQRGIDSVAALSDEEVLTLGEDNQPISIKPPKLFGRIASKAREQALLNRFETEIELELSDKAKELAVKFRNSPEGFKQAMANHTAEMIKVEDSTVFSQMIENTGAQLSSNVYHRLQAAEAERFDANMAASNKVANAQGFLAYETLIGNNNFAAADLILQQLNTRNDTDLKAGFIQGKDLLLNNDKKNAAYARGILTSVIKTYGSQMSPSQLQQLKIAIDNNDADYLPDLDIPEDLGRGVNIYNNLKTVLRKAEKDILLSNSLREFAGPSILSAQNKNDFESAAATLRNQIFANELDTYEQEAFGFSDVLSEIDSTRQQRTEQVLSSKQERNRLLIDRESQEYANSFTIAASKSAQAFANGLIGNIVTQAKDLNDMAALQDYLAKPSQDNLEKLQSKNERMGDLASQLVRFNQDLGDEFKFVEQLQTTANSFNNEVALKDAQVKQDNFYNLLGDIRNLGSIDDNKAAELSSSISNTNLSKEDAQRLRDKVSFDNGRNKLSVAFGAVKDASKLSALGYYAFEGKEREGGYRLSLREKRLIDEAKKQMGVAAVSTEVTKKLNTIGTAIEDEQERAALYSRQSLNDKGQLANTKDHRDETNTYYNSDASALGYDNVADFLTNPKDPDNPEGNQILSQKLRTLSVLPEDFFVIGRQLAAGDIVDPNASKLRYLAFYENVRNRINIKTGNTFTTDSFDDAFSPEEIAILDSMVDQKLRLDPSLSDEAREVQLTGKLNAIRVVQTDKDFEGLLTEALDKKDVSNFVITEYPDLGVDPQLRGMIEGAIRIGFAEAKVNEERFVPKHAKAIADKVINSRMEKDDLITSFGVQAPVTRFGLNQTTGGDRDLFITYMIDELRENVVNGDQIDWENENFKLVRVGNDTVNKGQTYIVVDKNKVAYPMEIDDGEGGKIQIGTFISTREPKFIELKRQRDQALALEGRTKAEKANLADDILEEYPLGSQERQTAGNNFILEINQALLDLENESDLGNEIYQGLNPDTLIYFSNPSSLNEGNMSDNLSSLRKDLTDLVESDINAPKLKSVERISKLINQALGFIASEQRPLN